MPITDKVYELCTGDKTVSSELARDPSLAPGKVHEKLYGRDPAGLAEHKHFQEPRSAPTEAELQRAYECGKWGPTKPSKLFLQVRNA